MQCEDWLVVRQWSKDVCLSFSHLISIFKMFSLDTVLAVITIFKAGKNPKACLVVSGGPWVWVQPGGWGPRGLPGATPSQHAHVPSPPSEWPQAGDPAQDQAELLLRLFSPRQPRPRCPFLSAERDAPGERQGVNGTTSKCRWCRLPI